MGTSILVRLGAITPVGWVIIGTAVVTIAVGADIYYYSEHTKGARPKHEKEQTRKGQDKGGEKGDARRKPNPNKRNPR